MVVMEIKEANKYKTQRKSITKTRNLSISIDY